MVSRLLARLIVLSLMLWAVASFAAVTPYPPYPGALKSPAYEVTVDGQPVFVHRFSTFNQFQWMDYASFAITGKVRVTVTGHVGDRDMVTCDVRPLAYGIKPVIKGNTASFELDRPRYLVVFVNEPPNFQSHGLMLFAEPPENNPPKLGAPNVVNIGDYKVDNTGKTVETAKINQAISDISAKPGGGVLFFPAGAYKCGTIMMKSNVRLYVDAGAVIQGTRKSADYTTGPSGGRRAQVVFDKVENASITGRGAIDMEGYPWLWHDFQPDLGDGSARAGEGLREGLVNDPRNGIKGYTVTNCRNISFQGLLLLRTAHWTVTVTDTENFSSTNIKIVNRKQQFHDDAYDFAGNSKHILVQDGLAMCMDDVFAFYGGSKAGLEDVVVKGFVDYGYTSSLTIGYGSAPSIRGLRFEDVHYVSNQNRYALSIQITPAYFVGRGYFASQSKNVVLDNFRFVNCTFEGDGGHIYFDGGDEPLTNFVFENCTFYKGTRPSMIMGKKVAPILFKNVKVNGAVVRNADQLKQAGFTVSVPVKFEP
jgi:hypothetical protein